VKFPGAGLRRMESESAHRFTGMAWQKNFFEQTSHIENF